MLTWQTNKSGDKHRPDLSARLSVIAESLPRGGVVCDVGSDHGALALYLLEKQYCSKAIVTDLNSRPLARAKENLTAAGVAHRALFLLTDGICDVLSYQPDAFVIAGMGGETISGILDRAKGKILPKTVFILQPMTRIVHLRRYLYESGFCVTGEEAVLENGKVFLIFKAVFDGTSRFREDDFYMLGEHLSQNRCEANRVYYETCLLKLDSKIAGKQRAGLNVDIEQKQRSKYLALLEAWNENS